MPWKRWNLEHEAGCRKSIGTKPGRLERKNKRSEKSSGKSFILLLFVCLLKKDSIKTEDSHTYMVNQTADKSKPVSFSPYLFTCKIPIEI